MRFFELSHLALAVLGGGMLCLAACTSAPRTASGAAPGALPAGAGATASGGSATLPSGPGGGASPADSDPHSFARPSEVAVEHLALDLTVDFEARRLSGRASLRLRNHGGAGTLYLDTRDLDIRRVTLADGKTEAPFTLGCRCSSPNRRPSSPAPGCRARTLRRCARPMRRRCGCRPASWP